MIGLVLVAFHESTIHNGHVHIEIPHKIFYVGLILLSFIQSFVYSIAHVGLSDYVIKILNKEERSIFGSLRHSFNKLTTIFSWSMIDTVLRVILANIKNHQKRFPFNYILSFFSTMLFFAWNVLTFFVIPIIATRQYGVIETIKESGKTMKKTWGEAATAHVNINIISSIIAWVLIIICYGTLYIGLTSNFFGIGNMLDKEHGIKIIMTLVVVLIFLPFMITAPFSSAASTIVKTALYEYTQGKPMGPFDEELIKSIFTKKSES